MAKARTRASPKFKLSKEQLLKWRTEIFSWGFNAGANGAVPLPHIFEAPKLAQTYAEGFFVAKIIFFIGE